jgi:hypothetical protein
VCGLGEGKIVGDIGQACDFPILLLEVRAPTSANENRKAQSLTPS